MLINNESVKDFFKDENYKPKTLETYSSRLKWLEDYFNRPIVDILKDYEYSIDKIAESSIALTTKKLLFTLLKKIAQKLKMDEHVIEDLGFAVTEYANMNDHDRRQNKVSDKNKYKWATWKELQQVYFNMNANNYDQIEDKLIVGLYTRMGDFVPRLDYAGMKVITSPKEDSDENHIYWNKKDNRFEVYLSKYKTDKYYGTQIMKVKDIELNKLLIEWFKKFNTDPKWLLTSYSNSNEPLSRVNLSKRISHIFNKQLGKPITNQIIRQVKESYNVYGNPDYQNMTLDEKVQQAKKMQHSYLQQAEYAKKD